MPNFPQRWTRIILGINFIVFALICLKSGTLFNPSSADLIFFGAKDPLSLARGEWWRLITPIFLHVGLIHFLLNNAGLHYIGPFFESYLGARWFVAVYLCTGIMGNIASGISSLGIGAGASGALFGVVGVGMVLEWRAYTHHQGWSFPRLEELSWEKFTRLLRVVRAMPFTWLACINLGIALAFNFLISFSDEATIGIDNAAHLGGMGTGIVLGLAYIWVSARAVVGGVRRYIGYGLIALVVVGIGGGGYLLTATSFTKDRIYREAERRWMQENHLHFK